MIPPRATYRLQFNRAFTFADAARIAPYLADLGISHVYASPWLKARAGSTHGYDIVDHNAFNPELGGEAGFEHLSDALREHGLGHILDFVPNHMGIAQADNVWWRDVLEWGRASPFAKYFDIRWHTSDARLRNKVLLPFLGKTCDEALRTGALVPRFNATCGAFDLSYYQHRFPLAPHTCASLIRPGIPYSTHARELEAFAKDYENLRIRIRAPAAEWRRVRARAAAVKARLAAATSLHAALAQGLAALTATPSTAATRSVLQHLLDHQHWRLAYWRSATDEINYRRFFDVNALAAVRVEDLEVFTRLHRLVARLLSERKLDGLRIDHIDGLYDPAQYLRRLRRMSDHPFFLVVEKILAGNETLPARWPTDGTTGYDFLDQVTRLLVDARSETAMTLAYRSFIEHASDFDEVLDDAKLQVIRRLFRADLRALARELHSIAQCQPGIGNCTSDEFAQALQAIAAAFAVYRTYVDARGASAQDRDQIARAVKQARTRCCKIGNDIFEFIEAALTTDFAAPDKRQSARVRHFAMRFQQFTTPVMAKGFEDTALYRSHRLIALNDVGGDPRQFALSPAEFHRMNLERSKHWPHALLATATHDSKRGEDARARLAALSIIPDQWAQATQHWTRLNRPHKSRVHGKLAPDRNDEYLLYQTLIGAWSPELTGGDWNEPLAKSFIERMQAYMTKALHEAKLHTSWLDPDCAYEHAMSGFVARILSPEHAGDFLHAFLPFQARVQQLGVRNSLVQLALKLTCPGVPDIYQGCELWDFNLVDPDNRRPVDFDQRAALLAAVRATDAMDAQRRCEQIRAWITHWQTGAIKLFVLHQLLRLRAEYPRLFANGDYLPLNLDDAPDDVIAFERRFEKTRLLIVANLRTRSDFQHPLPVPQDSRLTGVLSGLQIAQDDGIDVLMQATGLPFAVVRLT